MHFHQKIHEYLLNYRNTIDPSFNFMVRQRASKKDKNFLGGKFAHGLVFQGNNNYCFVGIVNRSGGANATRSVGLVFKPTENKFRVLLEIVFPGETNQELIRFYKNLASKFNDVKWDPKGIRAYKNIGEFKIDNPELIYNWLNINYPIIQQTVLESGIDDLIPSDDKFDELQLNLKNKLKEASKEVKSSDNIKSETIREKFSNWLRGIENSNKINSYLCAIDILNETLGKDIYLEKNIAILTLLYQDLIENQRDKKGKYFYASAPSYGNNGFYSASVKAFIEFLKEGHGRKAKTKSVNNFSNQSKNQIFYGPPGTGKTYNTVTEAVAIIQNKTFDEVKAVDRQIVKKDFDTLSKRKQVMFTTFHQSMSYEDFVEGIKPVIVDDTEKDNQDISYEIQGGIFKQAAARAAYYSYKEFHIESNSGYTYSQLYEAFIEMAREKIAKEAFFTCETKTGSFVEIFRVNKNDSIHARAEGSLVTHVAPLTKENIQKLYDTYKSVNEINHLQEVRDVVGVTPRTTEFYAVFKALLNFEKNDFESNNENEELKEIDLTDEEILLQFDSGVFTEMSRKFGSESSRVVLVVDEINRGNVSAIFGELITLLEEDKRLGEANELVITLPYSKGQFSVPSNLYIVGTMNTADRSVEALDTALRRRFEFKEMMPDYTVIKNEKVGDYNLSDVLETINQRIELLIDRDHTIGHSYFVNVNTQQKLVSAFKNKIAPLLQEYFYGDYGKIGLVLGKGFVKRRKNEGLKFSSFKYEGKDEFVTPTFLMKTIDESNIIEALKQLLETKEK